MSSQTKQQHVERDRQLLAILVDGPEPTASYRVRHRHIVNRAGDTYDRVRRIATAAATDPQLADYWARQLDRRDRRKATADLIRTTAKKFFPDHSATAAADALVRELTRYELTAWKRTHAHTVECPAAIVGTIHEPFWHLLVAGDVPKQRTIRKILCANLV